MATRVDFYRLNGDDLSLATCLIAGKAYQAGYQVQVLAAGEDERTALDTRLWTYRPGGFVPHAPRDRRDPDFPEPVVLSSDCRPAEGVQVLVCRSPPEMDCIGAYTRVAELVPPDPEGRNAARARYVSYKDAGYELHTHDLAVN